MLKALIAHLVFSVWYSKSDTTQHNRTQHIDTQHNKKKSTLSIMKLDTAKLSVIYAVSQISHNAECRGAISSTIPVSHQLPVL